MLVLCDVARGAEELVCVLVLTGVARRKKGGDVTGLLKLFSWFPNTNHHSVPGSVCKYCISGI